MNIVVLKFGGSSVSNNENLNLVADKILKFKKLEKKVVVIVSAQGKTTDKLIKEAYTLSKNPIKREMDMLISVGEQISASKLAIVLNDKNEKAISLNSWQAKIKTDGNYQKAKIISIDKERIINELNLGKIVIITGFQGIDNSNDINTLGRGGSDTTAVAIAHVLNAEKCYIFSDVDGVYSADPKKISNAIKLNKISFNEMQDASFEGAKVLHDRCVMLASKYNLPIISASTFNNNEGSIISSENIEEEKIKTIIKNDNIIIIKAKENHPYEIIKELNKKKIIFGNLVIKENEVTFTILKNDLKDVEEILKEHIVLRINVSKVSIIGSGISNNSKAINDIIETFELENKNISLFEISAYKISILFNKIINDQYISKLHEKLIT